MKQIEYDLALDKEEYEFIKPFSVVALEDKRNNGYKITSKHLLLKETEVVTCAIEILNKENIYVGYIFDGLLCKKSDSEKVKRVIDNSLKFQGINTYSKI